MTDEKLKTLVGNLVLTTASNAEANRELRATVENQGRISTEANRELRATVENQGRTTVEGLASLRASIEIQLMAIENQREITLN